MKILVLGDIHGRTCWKNIINKEQPDLTIFLGDYVSTHGLITEEQQVENLEEILKYKESNPDKVILLRGNHDLAALNYCWAQCYPETGDVVNNYMKENSERFLQNTQWVYLHGNKCFSHAGVSSIWMNLHNIKTLEEINSLEPSDKFAFTPSKMSDFTGTSVTQPPVWIRPWTLVDCGYKGVTHIVGHTDTQSLCNYKEIYKTELNSFSECENMYVDVWCCDRLPREYLVIEDDNYIVKKYEIN